MIVEIFCQLIIEGFKFDPDLLTIPERIRLIQKYRKGDLITFGRKKGDVSQEGFLILEGDIDEILLFMELENGSKYFEEVNAINISILVCYEGECNFELTQQQLMKIAKLEVPLGITCFCR